MAKVKAFLKRKDIIISVKRYGIDALGAMGAEGRAFRQLRAAVGAWFHGFVLLYSKVAPDTSRL